MRHREFVLVRIDAETARRASPTGLTRDGRSPRSSAGRSPALRRSVGRRTRAAFFKAPVVQQRGPRGGDRDAQPLGRRHRGLGPRLQDRERHDRGRPRRPTRRLPVTGDRRLPAVDRPGDRAAQVASSGRPAGAVQAPHRADLDASLDRCARRASCGAGGWLGIDANMVFRNRRRRRRVRRPRRRPRHRLVRGHRAARRRGDGRRLPQRHRRRQSRWATNRAARTTRRPCSAITPSTSCAST